MSYNNTCYSSTTKSTKKQVKLTHKQKQIRKQWKSNRRNDELTTQRKLELKSKAHAEYEYNLYEQNEINKIYDQLLSTWKKQKLTKQETTLIYNHATMMFRERKSNATK
jgi:ATP-dependent exoDNAse (exonuclease V) alpha subunit